MSRRYPFTTKEIQGGMVPVKCAYDCSLNNCFQRSGSVKKIESEIES